MVSGGEQLPPLEIKASIWSSADGQFNQEYDEPGAEFREGFSLNKRVLWRHPTPFPPSLTPDIFKWKIEQLSPQSLNLRFEYGRTVCDVSSYLVS